ncbi:MAG: isoprenyl transferase [Deltaproteobacteria bacterium]|nr:MAG: isoprenyl transferase [Deltaproteobacteria bacterium]
MDPRIAALQTEVMEAPVPDHVAIIMDGNGRWAEERGRPRLAGHSEGARSVRAVTRTARRIGVRALTLYAFSAQNWARPPEEVEGLMDLLRDYLIDEREELLDNDIRLEAVGELDRLPARVREPLDALRAETARCATMVLTLCLSYGGREEIVAAARHLAREVARGALAPEGIDAAAFAAALWTGDLPEPDLIIRTSGEKRLSNFLLWGSAYAEMIFTPTLWPDFRETDLLQCIREYQRRERRFGRITAQLRAPDGL